ncbi:DUF4180 domain-containing protein [Streptomyces roseicoloratus]|uniref:DUF4180 domain-containing protein n=1 Tax=Streptomyces roseicoloratus TaxID=2508722 RepID=UPI001009B97E|nr:DUF4180 domain-containing protein [Streptomyces roseicoloratus]
MNTLRDLHGTPVLLCPPEGPLLLGEREAVDVIGEGSYAGASWVAVPVERLPDDFFRLRTRVAGDIVQKFATYRLGLAVVGDIPRHLEESTALRDFVRESNRGTQLWFVPDTAALAERLAPTR